jgi:hypothetical protein
MHQNLIAVGLACSMLLSSPSSRAQASDEVKKLKEKVEFLQSKLELLQKEIELLKKENALLRKETGTRDDKESRTAKQSATVDETEYVVNKVSRIGTRVTLAVIATNAGNDTIVTYTKIEAVDAEGNTYTQNLKLGTGGFGEGRYPQVKLREGIPTKLTLVIQNVPRKVNEFKLVEVFMQGSKTSIQIKNVKLGK